MIIKQPDRFWAEQVHEYSCSVIHWLNMLCRYTGLCLCVSMCVQWSCWSSYAVCTCVTGGSCQSMRVIHWSYVAGPMSGFSPCWTCSQAVRHHTVSSLVSPTYAMLFLYYTVSQKTSHIWLAIILTCTVLITIIFGTSVTEEVGNQNMLYFPTSPNLCFCTTWENRKPKKCICNNPKV